jgi:hypothetical protein
VSAMKDKDFILFSFLVLALMLSYVLLSDTYPFSGEITIEHPKGVHHLKIYATKDKIALIGTLQFDGKDYPATIIIKDNKTYTYNPEMKMALIFEPSPGVIFGFFDPRRIISGDYGNNIVVESYDMKGVPTYYTVDGENRITFKKIYHSQIPSFMFELPADTSYQKADNYLRWTIG